MPSDALCKNGVSGFGVNYTQWIIEQVDVSIWVDISSQTYFHLLSTKNFDPALSNDGFVASGKIIHVSNKFGSLLTQSKTSKDRNRGRSKHFHVERPIKWMVPAQRSLIGPCKSRSHRSYQSHSWVHEVALSFQRQQTRLQSLILLNLARHQTLKKRLGPQFPLAHLVTDNSWSCSG